MNWFTGSIPDAVGLAKSSNAIFLVYIHDGSEASKTTDEALAEGEFASVLNSKKFVALKLENGTEGAKQFSQIYPLVLLPSLYFISGNTGIPLEILGGAVTKEKLKEALDKFAKAEEEGSNNVQQSNSESAPEDMVVDEPVQPENEVSKPTLPTNESQGNVEPTQSTSSAPGPSTSASASPLETENVAEKKEQDTSEPMEEDMENSGLTLEERVERAKVLLAEKQAKKQDEQAEDDKKKEIERRKMGQEIAKRKRQMHEEEVHSAVRERKKEKDEDRAARERVRAQIAADRREREARAALLQGQPVAAASHEPAPNAAPAPAAAASASNSTITRIKFRLPDGSSSIAQFPVEAKLSEVREHVRQQLMSSAFTLTSTMHHGPFTSKENDKSLSDLGLVPSAILVVLSDNSTSGGGSIVSSGEGIMQFLWFLLSPITLILGFVRQLFSFGSNSSSSSDDSSQAGSSQANTQQRPSNSGRPLGSTSDNRSRREGNIYRLRNINDDDDNNTWNGNSTQQM